MVETTTKKQNNAPGDKNPKAAKQIVENDIQKHWTPLPTMTEKINGHAGGRNTSPWTNFQPLWEERKVNDIKKKMMCQRSIKRRKILSGKVGY